MADAGELNVDELEVFSGGGPAATLTGALNKAATVVVNVVSTIGGILNPSGWRRSGWSRSS